jgi:hypothetical protein
MQRQRDWDEKWESQLTNKFSANDDIIFQRHWADKQTRTFPFRIKLQALFSSWFLRTISF